MTIPDAKSLYPRFSCVSLLVILAQFVAAGVGRAQPQPPERNPKIHLDERPSTLIKGGEAAAAGEFPTTVGLTNSSGQLFCSGALLTPELVLTAAHCLQFRPRAAEVRVYVGTGALGGVLREDLHEVAAMAIHPDYGSLQDDKDPLRDLAWLRLAHPIKGIAADAYVKPLLHWREIGFALQPGGSARIAGFGCQDHKFPACTYGTKRWADVALLQVNPLNVGFVRKTGMALQGDSGGPAFVQVQDGGWRFLGVTSTKLDSQSSRDDASYALMYPNICWLQESSGVFFAGAAAHCVDPKKNPVPDAPGDSLAACLQPPDAEVKASFNLLRQQLQVERCEDLAGSILSAKRLDLAQTYRFSESVLRGFQNVVDVDLAGMQRPPLHALAQLPHLESVRLSPYFLRSGELAALRTARPQLKITAWRPEFEAFNAIESGDLAAFEVALAGVPDLTVLNSENRPLVHAAIWRKRSEMLAALIAAKANINAIEPAQGHTALHYAVISDHLPIVRMLVAAGARPSIRNKAGDTPLDLAIRFAGNPEIKALLSREAVQIRTNP